MLIAFTLPKLLKLFHMCVLLENDIQLQIANGTFTCSKKEATTKISSSYAEKRASSVKFQKVFFICRGMEKNPQWSIYAQKEQQKSLLVRQAEILLYVVPRLIAR